MITYAHSPAAIDAAAGSSWTLDDYAAAREWSGVAIVAGVSNNRDAHPYEESNFRAAVAMMSGQEYRDGAGDASYGAAVAVVSLRSPFVGWVEFLAYDAGDAAARTAADDIVERLASYPLLDEDDAGERQFLADHPRGTEPGAPCYAEAGLDCHSTDDMGYIVPVCERCGEPIGGESTPDYDAERPFRCDAHPVYLDPVPGQLPVWQFDTVPA